MSYDVVVAGGGTAGCVLAGRLSERAAGDRHGFLSDAADVEVLADGFERLREVGYRCRITRGEMNTNLTTAAIAEKIAETI